MSVSEFKVAHFDQYYDIPLRGVIKHDDSWLPFVAEVDQHASDEAWLIGIPTELRIFPKNDRLGSMYETITKSFRDWNAKFRKGEVPEATHPSKTDQAYISMLAAIEEVFQVIQNTSEVKRGFFSVEDEVWHFRTNQYGRE